jgi:flagellar motor component MotA
MKSDDFIKEYHVITKRAVELSDRARREGLLANEEFIDEEKYKQRDVMELGLRLIVDGTDRDIVNKILTNIISLETDNDVKTLMTIKKEAILSIQEGDNPRLMLLLLNSYVNIEIESMMEHYNKY